MNNESIVKMGKDYVMNTYSRHNFALVRGQGSYVWDANGNKYLDMVAGIAVNNIGHCHPKVVEALREQAGEFLHCSNLYWIEPQVKLAKLLVENSFATKAFFCNSGAEANEAAIKLARKYSYNKYGAGRAEIITAHNSFHGRTLTALSATGQEKYQKGFEPLTPSFKYVPYNDLRAIEEAVGPETCAILLEPLQGEGGVNVPDFGYIQGVREICDKHDLLLMLDEVQTGLGRTGKLFAYEHYGIIPDVITLAKGLGGGVPIGACIAGGDAAEVFKPGDHAATFGGNPLSTAAALATLSVIINERLAEQAAAKYDYIQTKVEAMQNKYPVISHIRGKGLLIGIALNIEAKPIQEKCEKKGLLINCVQNKVLRMVPPLNIAYEDIDKSLAILEEVLASI
jgi:predicted acetylornithine/succinylornithine family transaminase